MKKFAIAIVGCLLLTACDGGSGDATCNLCGMSLSSSQCNSIATQNGCTSGEMQMQTCGGAPVQGCVLHGCATGQEVSCAGTVDAGH